MDKVTTLSKNINMCDVKVDNITMEEVLVRIEGFIEVGVPRYVLLRMLTI